MSFQYTFDLKGKAIGVFVPLKEWELITSALKKKKSTVKKQKATGILSGIEKGLKQVNQIEKGKLKSVSIKQLLNEL